eukprot:scaffold6123_cov113-Isochrysis_galbana.AAC.10
MRGTARGATQRPRAKPGSCGWRRRPGRRRGASSKAGRCRPTSHSARAAGQRRWPRYTRARCARAPPATARADRPARRRTATATPRPARGGRAGWRRQTVRAPHSSRTEIRRSSTGPRGSYSG